jgi:hypothetical protein
MVSPHFDHRLADCLCNSTNASWLDRSLAAPKILTVGGRSTPTISTPQGISGQTDAAPNIRIPLGIYAMPPLVKSTIMMAGSPDELSLLKKGLK